MAKWNEALFNDGRLHELLKIEEDDLSLDEAKELLTTLDKPEIVTQLARALNALHEGKKREIPPAIATAWNRVDFLADNPPKELDEVYPDAVSLYEKVRKEMREPQAAWNNTLKRKELNIKSKPAEGRPLAEAKDPTLTLEQLEYEVKEGHKSLGISVNIGRHALKEGTMTSPLTDAQKEEIIQNPGTVIENIKIVRNARRASEAEKQ